MTKKQLYIEMNNAASRPLHQQQESECLQAIKKYSFSSCQHPRKLRTTLSDLGTERDIIVACGKCRYCRNLKQDGWFTRMWHETKAHKYCYFITLTYSGFDTFEEIPSKLYDAFWHFDNDNATGRFCWSPCCLRIEHLQYFCRNLRRFGVSFKYFACGEYGKMYGRCHFHIILWTDYVLDYSLINKAWSYNVGTRKNPKWISIGKPDIHDLCSNGTICSKGAKVDGMYMNAKNAFKYVAKYCCKTDKVNLHRLEYLHDFMKYYLNFGKTMDVTSVSGIMYGFVFANKNKFFKKLISKTAYDEMYMSNEDLDDYYYQLLQENAKTNLSLTQSVLPLLFNVFTTCSRAEGIGSVYLQSHLERLVAGNEKIFDEDYGYLVCPSYYMRKVKEHLCPILWRSIQRSDKYGTFSAQNRPLLSAYLLKLAEDDPFNMVSQMYVKNLSNGLTQRQLDELCRSPYALYDCERKFRIIIARNQDNLYAHFFRFDRSYRHYVHIASQTLVDFAESYYFHCNCARFKTETLLNESEMSQLQYEAAVHLADQILCNQETGECYNSFLSALESAHQEYNFDCTQHEENNYQLYNNKTL